MHKVIESKARADQTFQLVGGKLVKITIVQKGAEFFCKDEFSAELVQKALLNGGVSKPILPIQLSEATEADLLAAKSARPDQACNADAWIKFLKENAQPPPPIRVELVNASELQKDTVLRIHRDDSGKLESATVHKV
jgi:hypothetical protein